MKFRNLSRADKTTILLFGGAFLAVVIFWTVVINIAWHFIAKFW